MKYRRLGRSGLMVSSICLGTMTLGYPLRQDEVSHVVQGAIDAGVNFIDAANCYEGYKRGAETPGGAGEEMLGEALKGRREDIILTTKVGSPIGKGPQQRGLSATHIHRQLNASLKRLQTDYIDIYMIHWPDPYVPTEETLRVMETAITGGKVRYFGVSNHQAWQLCEFLWIADKRGWPMVAVSQIPYSMLRRDYENDLLFCVKHDIAVTPYQPLQGGLLTGKYKRKKPLPKGSRASEKPEWLRNLNNALFERLEVIELLAKEINVSMTHYTLAWTLAQKGVISAVVGCKSMEQIRDCLGAMEVNIPNEHFEKIDKVVPPPPLPSEKIRGKQ